MERETDRERERERERLHTVKYTGRSRKMGEKYFSKISMIRAVHLIHSLSINSFRKITP